MLVVLVVLGTVHHHVRLGEAVESTEGLQTFGFVDPFRAGGCSDLGYGLGLLMVKSSPGVTPKPRFGPNLDSTEPAAGELVGLNWSAWERFAFTRYSWMFRKA